MSTKLRIASYVIVCLACCSIACEDDVEAATTVSTSGSAGQGGDDSTTQGGGGSDGGGGSGGGAAQPIDGPADEWAWRPIEGTKCGNGSTAGIGVNLHPDSTDFFVLVSGGGACWDDEMCNVMPASIHLHEDLTEAIVSAEWPAVDRSDPNNPLSTASWVYVPYCTGDLHWGDRTAAYAGGPIEHRGASNMRTFLDRLLATRPATERVFLLGGSAGGYGVTLHWGTAKQVFGSSVEVHVLADASPLVMPQGNRWDAMKAAWAPKLPAGCTECADDPGYILDALANAYPTSRHGLMTYNDDSVISTYFGYLGDLPAAIDALQAIHHDPFPNTKYFIATGTDHGVLGDRITAPDGTTPVSFSVGWLLGDPTWHSVDF